MHGNVAEWTRSDYLPYPYKEKLQGTGDRKVVRGGSYIDHPKHAIAAARKASLSLAIGIQCRRKAYHRRLICNRRGGYVHTRYIPSSVFNGHTLT